MGVARTLRRRGVLRGGARGEGGGAAGEGEDGLGEAEPGGGASVAVMPNPGRQAVRSFGDVEEELGEVAGVGRGAGLVVDDPEIGRASCRERVYVLV